jgi:hypothetical protein
LVAGEWRQPAALTKNGDAHKLHLPPLALDLLRSRCVAMGMPKRRGRGPCRARVSTSTPR